MELPTPAELAENGISHHTTENPEQLVKLVLRTAKINCKHEKAIEEHQNRFYCLDCGYQYRKVRQSVLRRRMMLR